MNDEKIISAYGKLYMQPLYYDDIYERQIYRNALKDLMNELNLLPLINNAQSDLRQNE